MHRSSGSVGNLKSLAPKAGAKPGPRSIATRRCVAREHVRLRCAARLPHHTANCALLGVRRAACGESGVVVRARKMEWMNGGRGLGRPCASATGAP